MKLCKTNLKLKVNIFIKKCSVSFIPLIMEIIKCLLNYEKYAFKLVKYKQYILKINVH